MAGMAVPRPLLIVLLAAVLGAVAFYATRGGATEATTSSPPPAPSVGKPLKTVPPSKEVAPGQRDSARSPAHRSAKPDLKHTAAKPKPRSKPVLTGVPPRVGRALAAHKVVVVLFRQRGGDDSATSAAVGGLRGERGVSVFSDSINRLARYPRLVAGLGISQAPSVVIVGPSLKATLLAGYTDRGTLKQQVLDAR
jgi:hypothetical protein